MYVNIDKCMFSLLQIPMQWKSLKCTETVSQLCNLGLAGMYKVHFKHMGMDTEYFEEVILNTF